MSTDLTGRRVRVAFSDGSGSYIGTVTEDRGSIVMVADTGYPPEPVYRIHVTPVLPFMQDVSAIAAGL